MPALQFASGYDYKPVANYCPGLDLSKEGIFIFPVFVEPNHWGVAMLNTAKGVNYTCFRSHKLYVVFFVLNPLLSPRLSVLY